MHEKGEQGRQGSGRWSVGSQGMKNIIPHTHSLPTVEKREGEEGELLTQWVGAAFSRHFGRWGINNVNVINNVSLILPENLPTCHHLLLSSPLPFLPCIFLPSIPQQLNSLNPENPSLATPQEESTPGTRARLPHAALPSGKKASCILVDKKLLLHFSWKEGTLAAAGLSGRGRAACSCSPAMGGIQEWAWHAKGMARAAAALHEILCAQTCVPDPPSKPLPIRLSCMPASKAWLQNL